MGDEISNEFHNAIGIKQGYPLTRKLITFVPANHFLILAHFGGCAVWWGPGWMFGCGGPIGKSGQKEGLLVIKTYEYLKR